jgi:hypothetical protein
VFTLTNVLATVGTAVGVATLLSGAWQYRRSVHRNVFRVYADKYNFVVPPETYADWEAAIRGDSQKWETMTPIMIAYLNLIWEEYYLFRDHSMPRSLWKFWLPEIQRVLCSEFAKHVMKEFDFHFPDDITCGQPTGKKPE